jgi:hypothetical protein
MRMCRSSILGFCRLSCLLQRDGKDDSMLGTMRTLALCAAVLFCTAGLLCAQDVGSGWAGEWGVFQATHSTNGTRYSGAGLSISSCAAQRCQFAIRVMSGDGSHGEAEGFLVFPLPTAAVAHLVAFGEEHCTLQLALGEGPEIEVQPGGGDCSYFQTPGAKFEGKFPLHSRDHYVDDEIASCFAATSQVKLTLCRSEQLSKQKTQWMIQYLQAEELNDMPATEELNREGVVESALLAGCEHVAQAEMNGCLRGAFSKSQEELEARMHAWHDSMTEPGDPAVAAVKAKEVAGRYRRRFANSDVEGDHFTSIDRMTITSLGVGAIGFKVHLEFYNGHECSLEGKAAYARAGSFVYLQKSDDAQTPECVFEIVSEKNGVKLKDRTGGCKLMSCGERGGYSGTEFTFKERY